jgi:hypothetical protein
VDTEMPEITLVGPGVVNICRFAEIDPNDNTVTVSDNYDNIPDANVAKTGSYFDEYLPVRKEGLYTIEYNVSDNSGNVAKTMYRYVNVTDCKLSVGEGLKEYVKLYPNPSTGQFQITIQLPYASGLTVTITNSLGQVVRSITELQTTGNTYQLDLSEFGSGLYMVKVNTVNESAVFPLTISR